MNGLIPYELYIDFFMLYSFDTYKGGIKDFNRQSRLLLSDPDIRESNIVCYVMFLVILQPEVLLLVSFSQYHS